jgi:threonylcarbamoyladenosine tRNA methylthiotransferase MtaB
VLQLPAKNSVAFRTVGCRLNQCETAQMQEALLGAGFRLVDWEEPADIRVVNTCTVTAKSDRTCRHEIRSAKRLDPECLVVVTGCYAQVDPETAAAIPGVDVVLGNIDKLRLAEHLAERLAPSRAAGPGPAVAVTPYPEHPGFESEFFTHFLGYTRAFLKIQTGCDSRCAYCVIPLARGPARSMPRAAVLEQVRLLAVRDYREVVLAGINLGSWGRDTGEGSLADLLTLLLDYREASHPSPASGRIDRYRLSSIEPLEVDTALLDVIERSGERVAHHFHLPLQSGSDCVLRRMDRPYSASQYLEVAETIAGRFPDAALGADVIVGFPGETEAEFEETLALVERSPLTYLHVFAYSDRPGTKASAMRPKVHPETVHERSVRMRALGARKRTSFRGRLVGTHQRVLVLKERSADDRLVGLTGNYMEVLVSDDGALENRFVQVRLERPLADGRWETTVLDRACPAPAPSCGRSAAAEGEAV